jgi:hypothetical protein
MRLLEGEERLLESDNGSFTLTTHRAHYLVTRFGHATQRTIMLEDLDSCDIEQRSTPAWIALGVLLGLASFLVKQVGAGAGAIVVCGLGFWWSRKSLIVLRSRGTCISLNTTGMALAAVQDFVHEVESAKLRRRQTLRLPA